MLLIPTYFYRPLHTQGAIFFLPNMTYAQPPFYVHTMIAESMLSHVAPTTVTGPPMSHDELNVFAATDGEKAHVAPHTNNEQH